MLIARRLLLALVAGTLTTTAFAQAWPQKPIRLVVPFPPGGGTDTIAREISHQVAQATGWVFVIDNKPGAGGNIGVDNVAKSAPDGHSLVVGQTSNLAINRTLYAKLPYDPTKDLTPVTLLASAPMVLVTGTGTPYRNMADAIQDAKARPGSVNFASAGNGTVAHLAGELLQKAARVKFQHVPYRGAAAASTDVIGNRVELYMSSVPTLLGHIRSNNLRPLAITSSKRSEDLPDVPTLTELGYKDINVDTWFGLLAPAGTPNEIVDRLNAEFNKALQNPQLRKKLSNEGAEPVGSTPEKFAALIKDEIPRWGQVVKESGARID
ncbi:MAG: tripartite tricarboxylate transporter substrate binding protein [Hydrogenophaga sp.]|nr:tripartite tricarboxylate transporter substrate binding protein [Hydrogenophaga sp.]